MDYGLWLLIALLVVIALVFLLSGKRKADVPVEPSVPVAEPVAAPPSPAPTPFVDPIIAAPVAATPVVVEPVAPVEPIAPVEPLAAVMPIEPVAEPTPAPEPVPAPIPASPAVAAVADEQDDLLRLKGVGPKLKMLLIELGVTRYAQIAAWGDADIAAIDAKLGNFKGRPVRDHWVDQAKYLAAGDIAGFEAKYGKL